MEVLGISLVTNLAAGMTGEPLNHEEVLAARPNRRDADGPPAGRRRGPALAMARVLVTGSAGSVGSALVERLPAAGWSVRGPGPRADSGRPPASRGVVGDAFDPEVLDRVLPGCDAVVHLAAIPGEAPIADIAASHVVGTDRVLAAAVRHGVTRAVLAEQQPCGRLHPARRAGSAPTCAHGRTRYYGVGKVATEALGSLYHDRYGMAVAALRIGTFRDRPVSRRHLSTWLSPDDLCRLVDAALRAPDLGFAVVYGISANTRRWWDLAPAQALGYHPRDDAEAYAEQVLGATPDQTPDDPDVAYLGGWLAAREPAKPDPTRGAGSTGRSRGR